jgi:ABC-type Fe3+-hydroxamate transport system substrate-binding protein
MRRFLPLLLIPAIAIAASGCGPSVVMVGGKPRTTQYMRVVSLSPSTTELLVQTQTMTPPRFSGRTAADNWPKGQVENVQIVASLKPDYEKLATIKPDFVVYDADLYNADDVAKIKKIGGDDFVLDARTIDDLIKQIYDLGSKVGGETYMSDYVDKINQARASASGMTAHPKVAVIMPGSGGQHMITGTDSFIADVVKASGGDPVGPKAPRFVPLDPETLISQNPDWIFTSGDEKPFTSDPKFKTLKAVTSKHVVAINSDVLLRRGTRVDGLITAIHNVISK